MKALIKILLISPILLVVLEKYNQVKLVQISSHKVFDFGEISFTTDSIFIIRINNEVTIEIKELKEMQEFFSTVSPNEKFGILGDLSSPFHTSTAAREYLTKNGHPNRYAMAFVSGTLAIRILFNFFVKVNKPNVPVQLFPNETEAYLWLKSKNPE